MNQLIWKFIVCVCSIIATFQVSECEVRLPWSDEEDAFANQKLEDDIAEAKALRILDSLYDFDEGKQPLEEDGNRALTRWNSFESFFAHHGQCHAPSIPVYMCNVHQLHLVINQAISECRLFYIGWTGLHDKRDYLGYLLAGSHPKGGFYKNNPQRFGIEDTFYAHIDGTGVTEHQLVAKYRSEQKLLCTNGIGGKKETTGILYVSTGKISEACLHSRSHSHHGMPSPPSPKRRRISSSSEE